jgi:hypothetical protein
MKQAARITKLHHYLQKFLCRQPGDWFGFIIIIIAVYFIVVAMTNKNNKRLVAQ